MSILIENMEMPEDGETVTLTICADGLTFEEFKEPGDVFHAVPVPPHGRLIDASEKIRVQIYDDMTEDYHIAEMTIDDLLCQDWVEANAPTIIEAEEGEQ